MRWPLASHFAASRQPAGRQSAADTAVAGAGFAPGVIVDENFGRSLRVVDPDGVAVQVNEHDSALYT
jgi:hypothetical protein